MRSWFRKTGSHAAGICCRLLQATVWPTLEVFLTAYPAPLIKELDPATDLDLFELEVVKTMPDTNQEIRVIAEFQAKPGQETSLREVLHACVPPTRAEKENRGYTLHEDLDRPGRYLLYEIWVSRDAFEAALSNATLQDARRDGQAAALATAVPRGGASPGLKRVRSRLV